MSNFILYFRAPQPFMVSAPAEEQDIVPHSASRVLQSSISPSDSISQVVGCQKKSASPAMSMMRMMSPISMSWPLMMKTNFMSSIKYTLSSYYHTNIPLLSKSHVSQLVFFFFFERIYIPATTLRETPVVLYKQTHLEHRMHLPMVGKATSSVPCFRELKFKT